MFGGDTFIPTHKNIFFILGLNGLAAATTFVCPKNFCRDNNVHARMKEKQEEKLKLNGNKHKSKSKSKHGTPLYPPGFHKNGRVALFSLIGAVAPGISGMFIPYSVVFVRFIIRNMIGGFW